MNCYALRDKVAKKFIQLSIADSDEMYVRNGLYPILMDFSINDVELYCVGQFDNDLGIIKPCQPRLISWECYKFPQTRLSKDKFLTIEDIDKAAKEKKHEFLKEQKDTQIKDMNNMINNAEQAISQELKKDTPNQKRIKELRKYIKDIQNDLSKIKEDK